MESNPLFNASRSRVPFFLVSSFSHSERRRASLCALDSPSIAASRSTIVLASEPSLRSGVPAPAAGVRLLASYCLNETIVVEVRELRSDGQVRWYQSASVVSVSVDRERR